MKQIKHKEHKGVNMIKKIKIPKAAADNKSIGFPAFGFPKAGFPMVPVKSKTQKEFYRFNLKLKLEYKEYLSEASWAARISVTEYLNRLIEADRIQTEQNNKFLDI
jgi:hypothetical protein